MVLSLMWESCSANAPKCPPSWRDSDSGSVEGGTLKQKTVKARGEGVEYPALTGKVIRQVRFVNDEDYTALTIEFDDSTLVSFRFKANIAFSIDPEREALRAVIHECEAFINWAGWSRPAERSERSITQMMGIIRGVALEGLR